MVSKLTIIHLKKKKKEEEADDHSTGYLKGSDSTRLCK